MTNWLGELSTLCADRELRTAELHKSNDFYGHATLLKEYCGIPATHPLKVTIEHSPFTPDFAWEVDLRSTMPSILTLGRYRFDSLCEQTGKLLFSVGPAIHYASPVLDADKIAEIKAALGRTLLVFVPKSSHRVRVQHDTRLLHAEMTEVAESFDTVLVCLGWKDVLHGRAKDFEGLGYSCVSAGHMFDPLFLSRLRTLLELCDTSMSFMRGTHITYSILLNKPHYLRYYVWESQAPREILESDLLQLTPFRAKIIAEYKKLFGEPVFNITTQQRDYLARVGGLEEAASPAVVRWMLLISDELHRRGANGLNEVSSIALDLARELAKQGERLAALLLVDAIEAGRPRSPEAVLGLARLALELGDSRCVVRCSRQLAGWGGNWRAHASSLLASIETTSDVSGIDAQ